MMRKVQEDIVLGLAIRKNGDTVLTISMGPPHFRLSVATPWDKPLPSLPYPQDTLDAKTTLLMDLDRGYIRRKIHDNLVE